MKITLDLTEVMEMVKAEVYRRAPDLGPPTTVRFIHRYEDGSGEGDVDTITPIDRVEISFDEAAEQPSVITTTSGDCPF